MTPDEHSTHGTPEPPDVSERSETPHGVDSAAGELGEAAEETVEQAG